MHYLRRTAGPRAAAVAAAVITLLTLPAALDAQHAVQRRARAPIAPMLTVAPIPLIPPVAAYTPSLAVVVAAAGPDAGAPITLVIDTARASTGLLIATATVAAAVGAAGGALIGYNVIPDRSPHTDDPGLDGTITGWIFGPALVTPAAVHIVNDGRGNIAVTFGAALAIAITGYTLGYAGTDVGTALAVGAPLFQAISAVVLERHTARRRN